jgi:hypothetical protein
MDLLCVPLPPGCCVISCLVCKKGNSAYPYHFSAMTRVQYFVVDLAKGVKSFGDIKKLVDDVYGNMALKKTQI